MDNSVERECGALGGLFQAVINDLKIGVPLWEDFLAKATKLHCQLKSTTLATSAFLDSFQKIADVATNTRGATKDIGSALTRICLRQRSVEARMKTFTNSIVECLVIPMQERIEEWKKTTAQLDKDHAKEYKKARHEIKKKSSDTLRLQKKVKKASIRGDLQRSLDCALQDVNDKFLLLEETEKQAVRTALIEERSRFCLFVNYLKPVVDEEVLMLSEVTHLQEALETLVKHSTDPYNLPSGSEQVITDLKASDAGTWSFQTPPSSPNTGSSIGSRKSSMCSISSLTSSSSSSTKSHSSPSHQYRQYRSISQNPTIGSGMTLGGTMRLCSISSQDSGFTSQDTLFLRPHTPISSQLNRQVSNGSDNSSSCSTSTGCVGTGSASSMTSSTPSSPYYPVAGASNNATWPLQESSQFEKSSSSVSGFSHHPTQHTISERPHTISSAYEKFGHARPALTSQTFQPPEVESNSISEECTKQTEQSRNSTASSTTPTSPAVGMIGDVSSQDPNNRTSMYNSTSSDESSSTPTSENNPPLPQKFTEVPIKMPVVEEKPVNIMKQSDVQATTQSSVPDFNQTAPNQIVPQPIYMNMDELTEDDGSQSSSRKQQSAILLQQELNTAIRNNQLNNTQKIYQGHHRQSSDTQITLKTSHTSVLSSSGYGSGSNNPTPAGSEDTLISEAPEDILAALSKYSTLPRNGEWLRNMYRSYTVAMAADHKRPVSATEIGSTATLGCRGNNGIRRSISHANRPPPPVRRTSSISNPNAITIGTLRKNSLQAAECIYGFIPQRQSSNESVNSTGSLPDKPKPGSEVIEEDQSQNRANLVQHLNFRIAEQESHRRQSMSDIKSTTELNLKLTPPSSQKTMNLQKQIVETIVQKQADLTSQMSSSPVESSYKSSNEQKSHTLGHTERSALIQSLNSKLTQQLSHLSPGSRRAGSPDRHSEFYQQSATQHGHPPHTQRQFSHPAMSLSMPSQDQSPPSHASVGQPQSFKDALRAKLKHQTGVPRSHNVSSSSHQSRNTASSAQHQLTASPVRRSISSGSGDQVAERARQWLANRAQAQDATSYRESLLEQIKKGTRLRKVSQSDDRSDPRLS